MISAEAPILFAKGCDIFITELTMRAWIHAEENKRRTLQRSDIASALTKSDMFDFLIDIVPREEAASNRRSGGHGSSAQAAAAAMPQGAVAQQTGMHPPPAQQMQPAEYGMDPQMGHPGMYPGAVQGMPPSDPSLPYGQYPPQQIFNQPDMQNMYGYGMPQQPAVSDS
jgi:nuclear transcription factor Y gamma